MLEWKDEYSVGVVLLDTEHKKLIDILNKAINGLQNGAGSKELSMFIDEMSRYTIGHFRNEEIFMKRHNYEEYPLYLDGYIDFFEKILEYQSKEIINDSKDIDEVIEYINEWLMKHIQNVDKQHMD